MWKKMFSSVFASLMFIIFAQGRHVQAYQSSEGVNLPPNFSVNFQLIDTSEFPKMRIRFSQAPTQGLLPRWDVMDKTQVKVYEDGFPVPIDPLDFDPRPMSIVWLFDIGPKEEAVSLEDFREVIESIGLETNPLNADKWQFCSTRAVGGCLEPVLVEEIKSTSGSIRDGYFNSQYMNLRLGVGDEIRVNLETLLRLTLIGEGPRVVVIVKENNSALVPYFSSGLIIEMLFSKTPIIFLNRTQAHDPYELTLEIQATMAEIGGLYIPNVKLKPFIPEIKQYLDSRRDGIFEIKFQSQLFIDGQSHTLKIVFDANGDGYNDYTKQEEFSLDTTPLDNAELSLWFRILDIVVSGVLLIAPVILLFVVGARPKIAMSEEQGHEIPRRE